MIYLPGLELRRKYNGDSLEEDLHVIAVGEAGRCQVRVQHWETETPNGINNNLYRYSLDNQIGSSHLELDQDANILTREEYYPFGGTAVWSNSSGTEAKYKTVRYSGKERDSTGLYFYGYRYYMPWLGRWLNRDPAGTVDGLNLFRMVRNNPVTLPDLDGRSPPEGGARAKTESKKTLDETKISHNLRLFKGKPLKKGKRKLLIDAHGMPPIKDETATVPLNMRISFYVMDNQEIKVDSSSIPTDLFTDPKRRVKEEYREGTDIPNYRLSKFQGYHSTGSVTGFNFIDKTIKKVTGKKGYGYEHIAQSIASNDSVVDILTVRDKGEGITLKQVFNELQETNNNYDEIYANFCRPRDGNVIAVNNEVRLGKIITHSIEKQQDAPIQDRLSELFLNANFN